MAISMTATTGTDPSGPVEYYFDETSGNPGGTDSGWQTSPSYTDSGLDSDTQYTYTVQMRDAIGNTGTASAPANATTDFSTLLIEESFETDLSGGIGLGAWTTNNVDRNKHIWYTGDGTADGTPDGDTFGLAQSGGFLRREGSLGSAGISSAIDGSVDLVTPGTIYFSALIQPNNGDDTNHNAALILGSDVLDVPSGAPAGLMTAGQGIGFGLNGITLHAYSYDGGVGTESAGSVAATNGSTLMIVGKITWGVTDTLNLYSITNVNDPLPTAHPESVQHHQRKRPLADGLCDRYRGSR
jgi:hypothetical protein